MRNSYSMTLVVGCVLFQYLSQTSCAQEVTEVAGRSLDGWVADLDSANEIVRLRAVKSLRPFGAAATESLLTALDDESAGVRYWAASHLGDVGSREASTLKAVRTANKAEKNPAVALALAYAMCRLDKIDGNVDLLMERLEYPERGMACSAAEFLGKLGPDAASALPALEKAFRKKGADYHVRGASQNALRKINPEWKP